MDRGCLSIPPLHLKKVDTMSASPTVDSSTVDASPV